MHESTAELSLSEWYAMPKDEPGELVDGRLEVEEEPNYIHDILVMFLGGSSSTGSCLEAAGSLA